MKKGILFVDDEPRVLDGLKRLLRGMRNDWDVYFATSGREALERLNKEPVDVIVSDMLMPEMDGAYLLGEVMRRYPHTVRIILSGQAERESVLNSVRHAHQFLLKPCDMQTLKKSISRAGALSDLLVNERLKKVLSRIQSVPALPAHYARLIDELGSPKASIKDIGQIVSQDMGMTAKVLQLVNSAFFGLTQNVSNPAQAVSILGLNTIRALVLSVKVFSMVNEDDLQRYELTDIAEHCLAAGLLSKELAVMEHQDMNTVDEAFLSGVLHDCGKLMLAANLGEDYEAVVAYKRENHVTAWEAEKLVLGATHAEVGAYLLGVWGLPESIITAIMYHHEPEIYKNTQFHPLTAVHVADYLLRAMDISHTGEKVPSLSENYLFQIDAYDRLPAWWEAGEMMIQDDANAT
ncbi:response regulator [Desulfovibrio inopinatus]|uniref:response regulator n=1 Tax=Desulfovibrio inopinatus TaxID=102109 RepID=UPI0003F7077F|nr:response regulator [Desulfovibrio inopinatus]